MRRARLLVGGALVWGILAQVLHLVEHLRDSPLGRVPVVDAEAYWDWAGRIAGGQLVGTDPFFSAPLYPYLLGLLRALGGGLGAAYALNALLWWLSAALVARLGWRRYGPAAGALAAWLFVLAFDPFVATGRVLAGSLQGFLVVLVLERAEALLARPSGARALGLGLGLGLCTLAWPVLLPAIPLLGLWAAWVLRPRALGAIVAAAAALCILPATLHNVQASGEWIPISAHGGVTFYHGNNPGADGTFSPLGVSSDKATHHLDALAQTREARGPQAGWSDVSSYFFERGLDWWKAEPGSALGLAFVKLRYVLSARHYGDIYLSTLEAEESFGSWMGLGLLPLPAFLPLGLLALALLLYADWRRHLPDLLLIGAALGVCVVFWYTPRYRLPATPVLAVLGGWGLARLCTLRERGPGAIALAAALVLGLGSGLVNRASGFDDVKRMQPWFQLTLGQSFRELGELDEARHHLRQAAAMGQREADVHLADLARASGDRATALTFLKRLAQERPDDAFAQRSLAVALAEGGEPALAIPYFQRARELAPEDWQAAYGEGLAQLQSGQPAAAQEALTRARALAPGGEAGPAYSLAVAQAQSEQPAAALETLGQLLDELPSHESARQLHVDLLRGSGDLAGAVQSLGEGLVATPEHVGMGYLYAWMLATSRDAGLRDGKEALRVATDLCEATDYGAPELLDVLAAALAATGRFSEALERQQSALDLLPEAAAPELRQAMLARQASYERQEPHLE